MKQAKRLFDAGRYREAAARLCRMPAEAHVHALLGACAYMCQDYAAAVDNYSRAVHLEPSNADYYFDMGKALLTMDQHEAAGEAFKWALMVRPEFPEALHALGRNDEAIVILDKLPRNWRVEFNRGVALQHLNRFEEAIEAYDAALRFDPKSQQTRWNQAQCHAALGAFARCWSGFNAKAVFDRTEAIARRNTRPIWAGQRNCSLLVYPEQGFGDVLMFSRYLPNVAADYGVKVTMEVDPFLFDLFDHIPDRGFDLVKMGDPLPATDFHLPIFDLPAALEADSGSIPPSLPFRADPDRVEAWQGRLGPRQGKLRVGLAWSAQPRPWGRAIPLALFKDWTDVELVSLQPFLHFPDEEKDIGIVRDFRGDLKDFADTAALMVACDMVIAVDSGPAHLAGALGLPTFIPLMFSPDWRWFRGRLDSPWYPNARLFRQEKAGDWGPVLADMKAAIPQSPKA